MADAFEGLSEDALDAYLTGAAVVRGERLSIEQSGDEWVAALLRESALGGEVVILSVHGPDRRSAMVRLATLVAQAS